MTPSRLPLLEKKTVLKNARKIWQRHEYEEFFSDDNFYGPLVNYSGSYLSQGMIFSA
jgi:hypothetical protein